MADQLICLCNYVSESEIKSVLNKGATTTEEIQEYTRAGTSCGRCVVMIDQMVKEHLAKQTDDTQQKLDL